MSILYDYSTHVVDLSADHFLCSAPDSSYHFQNPITGHHHTNDDRHLGQYPFPIKVPLLIVVSKRYIWTSFWRVRIMSWFMITSHPFESILKIKVLNWTSHGLEIQHHISVTVSKFKHLSFEGQSSCSNMDI